MLSNKLYNYVYIFKVVFYTSFCVNSFPCHSLLNIFSSLSMLIQQSLQELIKLCY